MRTNQIRDHPIKQIDWSKETETTAMAAVITSVPDHAFSLLKVTNQHAKAFLPLYSYDHI